jgi:hypothetical protein
MAESFYGYSLQRHEGERDGRWIALGPFEARPLIRRVCFREV